MDERPDAGAPSSAASSCSPSSSTTRAGRRSRSCPSRLLGARHPQLGQRGTRPALRGVLRPLLLHGPVPPGRPGVQPAARRARVPAHAGFSVRRLAAHQPGPASPSAPRRRSWSWASTIAIVGLLLATRVGARTPYSQIVVSLVLIGAGSGMTLVALTSASLADVEPEIAGAASGLVNVSQQLGAAVGLAVLVTVFNSLAGHGQLVPGATTVRVCPLPRRRLRASRALRAGCAGDSGVRRAAALRGPDASPGARSVKRSTTSPSTWLTSPQRPGADWSRSESAPATSASGQASSQPEDLETPAKILERIEVDET